MKKILIITAAFLLTICVTLFLTREQVGKLPTELNEEIAKSLVYIRGLQHSGSGVVIKSDENGSLILTNKHVCEPNKLPESIKEEFGNVASYIVLFTYNKAVAIAQPMKIAVNSDLCLLHTIQTNLEPASLANFPLLPLRIPRVSCRRTSTPQ